MGNNPESSQPTRVSRLLWLYKAAEQGGEMNYPELTAPLRELTKRRVKFTWTARHQKHFDLIKERLCNDRVMVPFDPARSTRLYSEGVQKEARLLWPCSTCLIRQALSGCH